MSQNSTLRETHSTNAATQRNKRYDLFGTSQLTLFQPTDTSALKSFADHFGVPAITLESFRKLGGKRIMCGQRRVFPPITNT